MTSAARRSGTRGSVTTRCGASSAAPGVGSGNVVQVPVHVCDNTVTVIGTLNPAIGNVCENHNHKSGRPRRPASGSSPPP
ncbi:chaplin [Streptomyces triticisoli]|uniref:chaplin n=1 Tax=Streptomyces triticisoli TaxID=2182797 RepID=UPI001E4BB87D|nr:chaplin [Streptomyces triticisoli]